MTSSSIFPQLPLACLCMKTFLFNYLALPCFFLLTSMIIFLKCMNGEMVVVIQHGLHHRAVYFQTPCNILQLIYLNPICQCYFWRSIARGDSSKRKIPWVVIRGKPWEKPDTEKSSSSSGFLIIIKTMIWNQMSVSWRRHSKRCVQFNPVIKRCIWFPFQSFIWRMVSENK